METSPNYNITNEPDIDKDNIEIELLKSSSIKLFSDPLYQAPTSSEVVKMAQYLGLSQRKLANLVGVHSNDKGSSTIRKWKAPEDKTEHRPIPYAAWRLMLIEAGLV
jgi:hypothetical protein